MTKHEKLERAKTDHKYALERIAELERELSKLRFTAKSRLNALQRLDPKTYGEERRGYDPYHAWRAANGG